MLRGGLKAGVLGLVLREMTLLVPAPTAATGKVLPASRRPEPPPHDPGSAVLVPLIPSSRSPKAIVGSGEAHLQFVVAEVRLADGVEGSRLEDRRMPGEERDER